MKYKQAIKFWEKAGNNDADVGYILRLLQTLDTMLYWNSTEPRGKESKKHIQAAITVLEFVGVKNVITDWDKVKGEFI